MNGASAGYIPGGYESRAQAPVPQVQGNADILEFMRQLSTRPQFQSPGRPVGGGLGSARAASAPMAYRAPGGEGNSSAGLAEMQRRDQMAQLGENAITRNMHKTVVPMGNGIYGWAHDFDTRVMTPGQQAAVSPQNAQFAGAGAMNPTARPQGADADFQRFMAEVAQRQAIAGNGGF